MKFIIEEKDAKLFKEIYEKLQNFYEKLDDVSLDVFDNLINDTCVHLSDFGSLIDEIELIKTELENRVR